MADKEFRIPFEVIQDSQTITQVMEREFAERGLDLHLHDVVSLEDDPRTKERVLKVRKRVYVH